MIRFLHVSISGASSLYIDTCNCVAFVNMSLLPMQITLGQKQITKNRKFVYSFV